MFSWHYYDDNVVIGTMVGHSSARWLSHLLCETLGIQRDLGKRKLLTEQTEHIGDILETRGMVLSGTATVAARPDHIAAIRRPWICTWLLENFFEERLQHCAASWAVWLAKP